MTKSETAPRYLCIHGHFYQPPRENPWLETVEIQPGAAPFHDWNSRITAECYAANAFARILDERGLIARILCTYDRISFNIGPTLLAWLHEQAPRVYQAILTADAESLRRFSGHGSAMAQVYNHVIMPLACRRDKVTQVRWGLRDFKARFRREPEGMWLPETAVDLETLDVLAEHDIRFTVLAPHQAKVPAGTLDCTRPYRVQLPSGRSIAVFFYDGPVSRAVAFEHLLGSGERFLSRLLSAFPSDGGRGDAQLVHIATDGETYGHHHKFGEMALAYVVDRLERPVLARRGEGGAKARGGPAELPLLSNYGEFLSLHPPRETIKIVENSAWSCAHGVERWRSDCGCNSGGNPGFHQRWRAPLRDALDALRDAVTPLYVDRAAPLLRDPWAARDDYIDVINDRSERSRSRFLRMHATRSLSPDEQITVWHLLELQRHSQLMYTSCGWFFDDIAGPEPTQIVQYAGRVVQLAAALGAPELGQDFVARMASVPGNTQSVPNGRALYARCVEQVAVDLDHAQIAASHVLTQLAAEPSAAPGALAACQPTSGGPTTRYACYQITPLSAERYRSGGLCLSRGRLRVTSLITTSAHELDYACVHFGGVQITMGIRRADPAQAVPPPSSDEATLSQLLDAADVPALLERLRRDYGPRLFTLADLPVETQREAQQSLLRSSLAPLQQQLAQLSALHAPLFDHATRSRWGLAIPPELAAARELTLLSELSLALREPERHRPHIDRLLEQLRTDHEQVDLEAARASLQETLSARLTSCEAAPEDASHLQHLLAAIELAVLPQLALSLWSAQNLCLSLREELLPTQRARGATAWLATYGRIAELLRVAL
jgi:hypothetical protein